MPITIDGTDGISPLKASGQIQTNTGTAAAPAIASSSDTDSGFFFGTNEVNISTGGSARAKVDSSGRLLVGPTTARSNILDGDGGNTLTPYLQVETANDDTSKALSIIYGRNNSNGAEIVLGKHRNASVGGTTIVNDGDQLGSLTFSGSDGTNFRPGATIEANVDATPGSSDMPGRLVFSTTADSAAVPTERLRITSAGKVQVTGTRGGTLQASDNDSLELYTSATSGNASTGGGITFYNNHGNGHVMGGVIHVVKQNGTYENSQSDMLFGTRINGSSVAYRARLTSHGSWETFSSTVNIDIANSQGSGNNEAFIYARYGSSGLSAGSNSFRVYTNGNVQNTNNSYGSISDQRLKENIVDATSQWDDIKALQVRKYNFREATGHQTHTQLGLIAQEVESVSPGLVRANFIKEGETCEDADGNQLESIKSINYSVLYMKAVKALQEAQTRIETLETQHADLLARVTALEAA
jgi:hypothetical protein